MKNNIRNKKGITLIEVLIVVSLFLIVLSSTSSIVLNETTTRGIEAKSIEIVEIISRARAYSVSGYLGDVWGIKVQDSHADCSPENDCLVLYKGAYYSERDSGYDQVVKMNSGTYIDSSEKNEFYFEYLSGWLSTSTGALAAQTIILKNNAGEQKTITTTPVGVVYYGD